jgi:hypothetical protein
VVGCFIGCIKLSYYITGNLATEVYSAFPYLIQDFKSWMVAIV